jgi:hypothetical protein
MLVPSFFWCAASDLAALKREVQLERAPCFHLRFARLVDPAQHVPEQEVVAIKHPFCCKTFKPRKCNAICIAKSYRDFEILSSRVRFFVLGCEKEYIFASLTLYSKAQKGIAKL